MEPLASDLEGVTRRASEAGVDRFLVPSVSPEDWSSFGKLAGINGVSVALGVHPWEASGGVDTDALELAIRQNKATAVGEIGLDWKCPVERGIQLEVFTRQLSLASDLSLPVSLHCRGAFGEMLALLRRYPLKGALHAWSRDPELMKAFIDSGLCISFGGAVTRPGAIRARSSAAAVPADRFVLETDAPSIGLEGIQAGSSEPCHLKMVLGSMSAIRNESPEAIAALAYANSRELFGG